MAQYRCVVCNKAYNGNEFSTCDRCHEYVCDEHSDWLSNYPEKYSMITTYHNINGGNVGDFCCFHCIEELERQMEDE